MQNEQCKVQSGVQTRTRAQAVPDSLFHNEPPIPMRNLWTANLLAIQCISDRLHNSCQIHVATILPESPGKIGCVRAGVLLGDPSPKNAPLADERGSIFA